MEEAQIIKGCLERDDHAYRALVEKYSPYLFAICKRYFMDDEMARDCLQESLIQIITKIDRYEERGQFKAWMSAVTVKKCLDIIRREKRFRFNDIEQTHDIAEAEQATYRLEVAEVMAFLETLPDHYRVAINMFLIEGYAHKDIADVLGISESTSRSLVSRGRRLITQAFEEGRETSVKKSTDGEDRFKLKILRS